METRKEEQNISIEEFNKELMSESLLFQFIREHDVKNLKKLLYQVIPKPNVNTLNKDKVSPLFLAITKSHVEITKILLEAHADIHSVHFNEDTPLTFAIKKNDKLLLELLLEKKLDVNQRNKNHEAPLTIALLLSYVESDIVDVLLHAKAHCNTLDFRGNTPLILATSLKKAKCLKILLDAKADINDSQAIHAAVKHHTPLIEILLKAKADPNLKHSIQGNTPLFSALSNHLGVKTLLEYKANFNITNRDGNTPLMEAVLLSNQSNQLSLPDIFTSIQLLVNAKANIQFKNKDHCTALNLAKNKEIRKYLQKIAPKWYASFYQKKAKIFQNTKLDEEKKKRIGIN